MRCHPDHWKLGPAAADTPLMVPAVLDVSACGQKWPGQQLCTGRS